MKIPAMHIYSIARCFTSLTAIVILLFACAGGDEAAPTRSSFERISPCPFEAASDADQNRLVCGFLSAPENRVTDNGATIKIPVAIIKAQTQAPKADPVVFVAGGPGAAPLSANRVYQLFSSHIFGVNRDIIIYNQRGSLMTEPALRCDRLLSARMDAFAANITLKERDRQVSKLAINCLQNLERQGRDLSAYSAKENALDLKDLREALGIEQWNLMAVSYGTIMSMEAVRADPDGVRSLVLDSIVSFESDLFMTEGNRNFARAMDRVLNACEESASCNDAFPDLSEMLASVLEQLKNQPVHINIAVNSDGEQKKVVVNWHDFLTVTHWMMYNAETLRLIPLLISETHGGDLIMLAQLMENVFPAPKNQEDSAAGAFFAVVCRDQYTNRERLEAAGAYDGFSMASFLEDVCSEPAFNYGQTAAYEPFQSDVPTLLLSGYFDPTTPDIYAEQAERNLTGASRITIPNYGHSTLSGYTACQSQLAAAFLNDLKPKSDFPCLKNLRGPDFITNKEAAALLFAAR